MSRGVRMFSLASALLAIGLSAAAVLGVTESPHTTLGGAIAAGLAPFLILLMVLSIAWSW